jgi:hypothetical protein
MEAGTPKVCSEQHRHCSFLHLCSRCFDSSILLRNYFGNALSKLGTVWHLGFSFFYTCFWLTLSWRECSCSILFSYRFIFLFGVATPAFSTKNYEPEEPSSCKDDALLRVSSPTWSNQPRLTKGVSRPTPGSMLGYVMESPRLRVLCYLLTARRGWELWHLEHPSSGV